MTIRTKADIDALEARPFEEVYPLRTPWDILRAAGDNHGDQPAIRYLHDAADPSRDEVVTYADLAARCMGAARVFRDLGVVPGRSVAILAQHTPMAQVALWGAQIPGHACPINPMLKPAHVASLLTAAGASALVVTGSNPEIDYWSTLVPRPPRRGRDAADPLHRRGRNERRRRSRLADRTCDRPRDARRRRARARRLLPHRRHHRHAEAGAPLAAERGACGALLRPAPRARVRRRGGERFSALPRRGGVRLWPVDAVSRGDAGHPGAAGDAQPGLHRHDLAAGSNGWGSPSSARFPRSSPV